MRLGIVIFPTTELQERADSYRKRYDPHYKLISPHLTVKEAFEATEDQLPEIENQLSSIAEHIQPFSIQVNKVSHFYPTNNVIYFSVEESPELNDLFTKIHSSELLQHERHYAFVPHITIGQKLPGDELHDIYGRLRTEKLDYTIPVQEFHLVKQLEDRTWVIQKTFSLAK